jgi:hypothetical protein
MSDWLIWLDANPKVAYIVFGVAAVAELVYVWWRKRRG